MINFLKTWTNIQLQLISNSTKPPIFHRPNHESTNLSLNQSIGPASKRACNTQTTIFKIENNNKNHKSLAEMCIYEAEKKIGKKPRSSKFVLYVKESKDNEIKITRIEREVFGGEKDKEKEKPFVSKNEISFGNFEEISFSKDCKPAYCSWWIRVGDDDDEEGVVMVVPSLDKDGSADLKIIATLPVEK